MSIDKETEANDFWVAYHVSTWGFDRKVSGFGDQYFRHWRAFQTLTGLTDTVRSGKALAGSSDTGRQFRH